MKTGIEIRFFPDWGRKEPLWSHDTDDIVVKSSDLPISEELASGLHKYMDFWEDHFIRLPITLNAAGILKRTGFGLLRKAVGSLVS